MRVYATVIRRISFTNRISPSFDRRAILTLDCSPNALIAGAFKLIQTRPMLIQCFRAKEKTAYFAAVFVEDETGITDSCTPALLKQSACH